jgi:predicted DNA-binding transcriptional regulator AlpA
MAKAPQASPLDLGLITEPQLAEALHLDRSTLWRYRTRRRNPVPHFRLGGGAGRVMYSLDEVRDWLRSCASVPASARRSAPEPRRRSRSSSVATV